MMCRDCIYFKGEAYGYCTRPGIPNNIMHIVADISPKCRYYKPKGEVEVTIEKDILDAFKRQRIEKIVSETAQTVALMLIAKISLDLIDKLTKALSGGVVKE